MRQQRKQQCKLEAWQLVDLGRKLHISINWNYTVAMSSIAVGCVFRVSLYSNCDMTEKANTFQPQTFGETATL